MSTSRSRSASLRRSSRSASRRRLDRVTWAGGDYSYAEVPLEHWVEDAFDSSCAGPPCKNEAGSSRS